jgi:hypothetical protein
MFGGMHTTNTYRVGMRTLRELGVKFVPWKDYAANPKL